MNKGGSTFFLFCQENQWDQHTRDILFIPKCVSWDSLHITSLYLTQRAEEKHQYSISENDKVLHSQYLLFTDVFLCQQQPYSAKKAVKSYLPSHPTHLMTDTTCRQVEIMGK